CVDGFGGRRYPWSCNTNDDSKAMNVIHNTFDSAKSQEFPRSSRRRKHRRSRHSRHARHEGGERRRWKPRSFLGWASMLNDVLSALEDAAWSVRGVADVVADARVEAEAAY